MTKVLSWNSCTDVNMTFKIFSLYLDKDSLATTKRVLTWTGLSTKHTSQQPSPSYPPAAIISELKQLQQLANQGHRRQFYQYVHWLQFFCNNICTNFSMRFAKATLGTTGIINSNMETSHELGLISAPVVNILTLLQSRDQRDAPGLCRQEHDVNTKRFCP